MRKTPLHAWHAANGGRFVDFHGWEMPVQYEGILAEAREVRTRPRAASSTSATWAASSITGPDREALVEHVFSGQPRAS